MDRKTVSKELLKIAQHLLNVKTLESLTDSELTRALRDAMIGELEAIKQYETIADSTNNKKVAEVLREIADEEKIHVGEIQKLLSDLLEDEQGFLDEGKLEVEPDGSIN